jgi:regulator of RNase E activity RraA
VDATDTLVTDGVVRDRSGVLMSGLPVWSAGVAAQHPCGSGARRSTTFDSVREASGQTLTAKR